MKADGLRIDPGLRANMIAMVAPAVVGLPSIERAGFRPFDDRAGRDAGFERRIAEPQPLRGQSVGC